MRSIYIYLVAIIALSSCKKNEDFLFDPNVKEINLWFGNANAPSDSTSYNFAYILSGKDSVMFNYRLMGYPLDKDLDFELEAVDGDTDKVQYEFGKYTIKAGQYQGSFPIYFFKPEGFSEFTETAGRIRFRLKESNELKAGVKELSTLNIKLQNGLVMPEHWNTQVLYYLRLSTYFGTYSTVKHTLLIQVSGKTVFRIYQNRAATIDDTEAMSIAEATNYANMCKKILLEYKEQNGHPLLDENGIEVTFP